MNILVTGAKGFVGRNLVVNLYNLKENKNRTRPGISIDEIYEYDMDSTPEELDEYCRKADFVFNLAGVNRPKDPKEFQEGNFGFASMLLDTLKKHRNKAAVMLSSSIQATLQGRFGTSEYGLSKKAGEDLFSPTEKKQEPGCWSTVSPIWWENGCAPIITPQLAHFAIISPTTFPSRSTTPP